MTSSGLRLSRNMLSQCEECCISGINPLGRFNGSLQASLFLWTCFPNEKGRFVPQAE